jgi:hypothetical protein
VDTAKPARHIYEGVAMPTRNTIQLARVDFSVAIRLTSNCADYFRGTYLYPLTIGSSDRGLASLVQLVEFRIAAARNCQKRGRLATDGGHRTGIRLKTAQKATFVAIKLSLVSCLSRVAVA